jgi:hypothetical protein
MAHLEKQGLQAKQENLVHQAWPGFQAQQDLREQMDMQALLASLAVLEERVHLAPQEHPFLVPQVDWVKQAQQGVVASLVLLVQQAQLVIQGGTVTQVSRVCRDRTASLALQVRRDNLVLKVQLAIKAPPGSMVSLVGMDM